MTTLTLASGAFVSLQLSGHALVYVNAQAPAMTPLERILAREKGKALVDPRARLVGELREIVELECQLTLTGMRDHWWGWFYEDGQRVKVDIWPEHRRLLHDYGHDIMPFAKLSGVQRVSYPVYLKLERGMLMIDDVLEKEKVA